jgi:hypothetical protein
MSIDFTSPSTFTTAILVGDISNHSSNGNLPTLTTFMGQPVSAAIEIQSVVGALLLPRMDTAHIAALNPADGMILYNNQTNEVDFRVSGAWLKAAAGPSVMNFTWNITGVSLLMQECNGYIVDSAGPVTLTLPAVIAVGDNVRVTRVGAGDWIIAQNPGQSIIIGNQTTTVGVGGSLQSSNLGDTVEILCISDNTDFVVLSSMGNITFV